MMEGPASRQVRHRWRFYQTQHGRKPVEEYIAMLPDDDFAEVVGAMKDVAIAGLSVARHLRGDIHEVRINGRQNDYRLLFATEGNHGEILLAVEAFPKKTQRTPPRMIDNAEKRLIDWRRRGKTARGASTDE